MKKLFVDLINGFNRGVNSEFRMCQWVDVCLRGSDPIHAGRQDIQVLPFQLLLPYPIRLYLHQARNLCDTCSFAERRDRTGDPYRDTK
jgi:hypothetical protein